MSLSGARSIEPVSGCGRGPVGGIATRPIAKSCALLALLLLSSAAPLAADGSEVGELRVEGLEPAYDGTAHVEFAVVNAGTETIFVDIVAQRRRDGFWGDLGYSISKDRRGKVSIFTELAPGARVRRIWDAVELPIEPGEYRFAFALLDLSADEGTEWTHSDIFRVRAAAGSGERSVGELPPSYREFADLSRAERRQRLKAEPIAVQLDLYRFAMGAIHPPDPGLADAIAETGPPVVPAVLDRAEACESDVEKSDLLLILGALVRRSPQAACNALHRERIGRVVRSVEDPFWREQSERVLARWRDSAQRCDEDA